MERLIKIVARRRDPIFDPSRHGLPDVMNDAQRCIAMPYLVWRNHARRHEIVNLIETYLLPPELLPDRIESLDSAFDANEGRVRLAHLFLNVGRHATEKFFVFRAALLELDRKLAIILRMQVLKCQVL